MSYLTNSVRTTVLLEALADAEEQLKIDPEPIRAEALLRQVIATAKRHQDWPKPEVEVLVSMEPKPITPIASDDDIPF